MPLSSTDHARIVSRAEWIAARKAHLVKEKALTRASDALARERQALPWVRVDKPYHFHTRHGMRTLADLFDGRSQLIVNHFMFGPGWGEGCVGCSFGADHVDGAITHLEQHDVTYVAVSRAPLAEIEAFRQRMGWRFTWVSSHGSDFNYDYHVSATDAEAASGRMFYNFEDRPFESEEMSGLSVFATNGSGEVFHTYSCYARGTEKAAGTYMLLDLTPRGRNETGPSGTLTDWVRHHDRYGAGGLVDATGRYQAAADGPGCCHSDT